MAGSADRLLQTRPRRDLVTDRARARSLRTARPGLFAAAALVLVAVVLAFALHVRPGEMRDFEVYWTAAARASAGEPLYRADDGHYQFKYLPAFAVLAQPIASLTLDTAKRWWFVASVALLCALLAQSVALLPELRRPGIAIVSAAVIVMGKFYGHELVLGQVNLLFAVTASAGILAASRGRTAPAAALLVAAVVVKPYGVILLPWFALVCGRGAATMVAAGLVIVGLLPAALYGLDGTVALHRAWWTTTTASTAPNLTNADNVSLAALFAKWIGVNAVATAAAAVTSVAVLALAAFVIWRGRRMAQRVPLEGALLLTVIPLLSPQGWDYVFLIATPAVALFVNYSGGLRGWERVVGWMALAVIGLSIYDVLGRAAYAVFMGWSVITLCFLVLAGALATLRIRAVA